jgi:hypothetical protein
MKQKPKRAAIERLEKTGPGQTGSCLPAAFNLRRHSQQNPMLDSMAFFGHKLPIHGHLFSIDSLYYFHNCVGHATKISSIASLLHWAALPGNRAFVTWHIASVHRSCSRPRAGADAIAPFPNWLARWIRRQHLSQPDLAYSVLIFSMELHSPRAPSICFYIHIVEGCSPSTCLSCCPLGPMEYGWNPSSSTIASARASSLGELGMGLAIGCLVFRRSAAFIEASGIQDIF